MIGTAICQDCGYSFYVDSFDTACCPVCDSFMDFFEEEPCDLSDLEEY